ncbi:esterase/lipase family protein [Chitiniphilus shinanonensis]|uniref:esterase/lipase family protein n=1 Tax=Chitiniphilus shinanonensis TaxID=553088 RepID=UPI00305F28F3
MEPIVIIHGWSDEAKSFRALAEFIEENLGLAPTLINLAQWRSMHDDVTYADLANAMQLAWTTLGLPQSPRSVNIVVHSTGALVVRDWMTSFHTADTVPIKRFLMLAPANFGSPLAHKGHMLIGRALKGWKEPGFQTGEKILDGLELGSSYTWQLADRDLFGEQTWYGPQRILATVLAGNHGYRGFQGALVNEPGSDGTVFISTANLNAAKLTLQLDDKHQMQGAPTLVVSKGAIGLGIVDEDHGSIIQPGANRPKTRELILQALKVTDADYQVANSGAFPWQATLDSQSEPADGEFQNTVIHLNDNLGQDITEYFTEFYRQSSTDDEFEYELYKKAIESVHPYSGNTAYRAFYINIGELEYLKTRSRPPTRQIYISMLADPVFLPPKQPVGYYRLKSNETGGLCIPANDLHEYFQPHRTLLVGLTLTRLIHESVFRLNPL